MTTLETARALGVQIRTVRKYMYDGEIAYTKIGNRCDISAEEIARFKAAKAHKAEERRENRESKDKERQADRRKAQGLRATKAYIKANCFEDNGRAHCERCDLGCPGCCRLEEETARKYGEEEARRVFGVLEARREFGVLWEGEK